MGISLPIFALAKASDPLTRARVDAFAYLRVERAEHVCRYGGIVYVGSGWYFWEEELAQCKCEGVAHCIDVDVRENERECIIAHDKRAQALTEEGEMRPGAAENPRASV